MNNFCENRFQSRNIVMSIRKQRHSHIDIIFLSQILYGMTNCTESKVFMVFLPTPIQNQCSGLLLQNGLPSVIVTKEYQFRSMNNFLVRCHSGNPGFGGIFGDR